MEAKDQFEGLSPVEKLKAENEFMKMKLTAEFGMKGYVSDEDASPLPLEVENQWLNNIYNYESLYKNAKKVSVYEMIGKPGYKKIGDLTDDEVPAELDRLMKVIDSSRVNIDFICDYDDNTMYKFLTEELFDELVDDIPIEGMRTCFIYEEFHPNHEYDIKEMIESFFKSYLSSNWAPEFHDIHFSNKIIFEGNELDRDNFFEILNSTREEISPCGVELLEFYKINFDLDKKTALAEGEISFAVPGEFTTGHISTEFKIALTFNEYDFWEVREFCFPHDNN